MKELLSHLFICCCVQVDFLSSHNCKVCTCGKFTQCYCNSVNSLVGWLRHHRKTSNSEETGPGECTREGDHRLKV